MNVNFMYYIGTVQQLSTIEGLFKGIKAEYPWRDDNWSNFWNEDYVGEFSYMRSKYDRSTLNVTEHLFWYLPDVYSPLGTLGYIKPNISKIELCGEPIYINYVDFINSILIGLQREDGNLDIYYDNRLFFNDVKDYKTFVFGNNLCRVCCFIFEDNTMSLWFSALGNAPTLCQSQEEFLQNMTEIIIYLLSIYTNSQELLSAFQEYLQCIIEYVNIDIGTTNNNNDYRDIFNYDQDDGEQ